MKATDPAPDGCIWVCSACAKTSPDLSAMAVRCRLNAVLCHDEQRHDDRSALIAGWVPVEVACS